MDPLDIVWKNLTNSNSNFNTITEKVNYPVDIYEVENGLRFEFAVVGLNKEDLVIQVEGNVLRVSHENDNNTEKPTKYITKGIARRSFDLVWRVSSNYDLSKLEAEMDKGLLIIHVPYAESKSPKRIEIKTNNKSLLKG
jgi:HSP20 family protein